MAQWDCGGAIVEAIGEDLELLKGMYPDVDDQPCPMPPVEARRMTLKEIEHKYGIEYYKLYNGLSYAGLLAKHRKNVQYDVEMVLRACDEYCQMRVMKIQEKMGEFNWVRNRIKSFYKNGLTESPPRQV